MDSPLCLGPNSEGIFTDGRHVTPEGLGPLRKYFCENGCSVTVQGISVTLDERSYWRVRWPENTW
jgi:hypothetical protein